ncbi:MAG: PhzF family phenazine biosynthesis protein [Clostridium butyricum]|nr:PhzF family phenazine biosynthesis protein [Clostridium butyricum]
MKKYTYKKINAFTWGMSQGNPAAYLMLGDDRLTENELLSIGKEHSGFVSEVVFCSNSDKADCKLTYYSSECEVDFCGHGTIATMYDVIKNDDILCNKKEVKFETNKKGILTIYNHIATEDSIYVTAPTAEYLKIPVSKEQIAENLEIEVSMISEEYPIDFINAGLRTLIVPITHYNDEISIFPNEAKLKDFCLSNVIDIILIFSKEASTSDFIAHTRVFAPKFGYLEDPATGSGNSAFGNYMLKNQMWNGESVSIEQGGENILFNTVKLKKIEDKILFGGKARVSIEGFYCLER